MGTFEVKEWANSNEQRDWYANQMNTPYTTTTTGTSTIAPDRVAVLEQRIVELEERINSLQAKIDNMKECPKCMRVTPRWSDDHYLCDDCR